MTDGGKDRHIFSLLFFKSVGINILFFYLCKISSCEKLKINLT